MVNNSNGNGKDKLIADLVKQNTILINQLVKNGNGSNGNGSKKNGNGTKKNGTKSNSNGNRMNGLH